MGDGKPLWRRGVQALDGLARPALEGVTRDERFGLGYAVFDRGRRAALRRVERISRHALHALNLPAASDVNRLLGQIAAVEHRVRALTHEVEDRLPAAGEVPGGVDGVPRPESADRP